MEKEPTVIIVALVEADGYGNLIVTDNMGNIIKVNKKHEHLHKVFQLKRAVKVYWKYYDFEGKKGFSVDGAELFNGKPPVEQQVKEITAGAVVPSTKPQIAPQAVGMITKEIGDHIRAGTLSTVFGKKVASSLVVWYRGQTLGITQIDFDGKDLPKFE